MTTYWLDTFTGATWAEFRKHGGRVSGFRGSKTSLATKVAPGDILLCYLTGVHRWVGALKVIGPSTNTDRIWSVDDFPIRNDVEPFIMLDPEYGVRLEDLKGKVDFFKDASDKGGYDGFFRRSPTRFKRESDALLIIEMMKAALAAPVARPVDARQLARKPTFAVLHSQGEKEVIREVSVPETPVEPATAPQDRTHTEIQHYLLTLGAELGLDVWVARNDRSRDWNGAKLGELPRVLQELPTRLEETTQRTVELIDVLWLKDRTIVAAFEIEHSTSVYSGILRMSDLLALQPNLHIDMYIVAPDERREKVREEIIRPTFALRDPPIPEVCGYLSYERLIETIEALRKIKLTKAQHPSFLGEIAEYFARNA